MSDDDEDYGRYFNPFSMLSGILGGSTSQPLSAAGRYLKTLERGDSAQICSERDIGEELQAQLRRIQIRSMWPQWEAPK